ncbi:FAD-dependent oxidoreductase [Gammaproteobacteria bacterium]|jgi:glycine/D-amino acid oxidase-like deaminating enzyme|nr:FAD-dependent oxidoreductase [Gammaproteobacteria bacterium]
MQRPFDENLYRFDKPQPSYWEATAEPGRFDNAPLQTQESCDVAIIGGGYTGLSAALHLARDYDIDVRVLEAGHFGWGASGRNGGFCCTGGTGVHRQELVRLVGLDNAREYYASQVAAVELVRQLASDESIDFQAQGSAEVEVAHTRRAYARLQEDHDLLTNSLGLEADLYSAGECRERFYDSTEQFGALVTRPTFGLHPLRYCIGLATAAHRHGAKLHSHSEVVEWSTDGAGEHRLMTRAGSLRARKVIFACNGFMQERLRNDFFGRTIPVISAIVVTRPLSEDEKAAQNWKTDNPAANSRRILNYFRLLPDGRFLFGGRGDIRGSEQNEQRTYENLIGTLRQIWPNWRNVEIEYRWHGLICMTASLCPTLGRLDNDDSVFFGFGYHGNGVNTATWTGKQLADWIGNGREPEGLPAIVRGLSRKYPLPGLRKGYLGLGLFVSRQLDRFR